MANRPTDWHVLDLDRDPVPGDPFEVKELSRKLGDFADDVSSALRSVRGLSGDNAVQDWAGLAGDAYREQFGDLPKELGKLEKSYRLASGALETYWPKLETAQADADRALAQGRTARQDLDAAKTTQTNANEWVKRAGDKSKEYQADPKPGVEPPSAEEVRAATRSALDASNSQTSANNAVHDAQSRLDAAKELAAQAAHLRDTAASTAEHALHEASDAGIKNKHWWEKAVDWVADHWDDIVAVCKVIVAVLGIVVLIIGGPLAWIVLAAALVVLADTLVKYAQGKASLWDVAFAALDCIPMFKGLTTAGGLLKMAKELPALLKSGKALENVANSIRKGGSALKDALPSLRKGAKNEVKAGKPMDVRCVGGDPIDMVTGEMLMSETDVELPGLLPLVIERHHVSSYRSGRWFGPSWTSTLDERLEADGDGVVYATADGMLLVYPVPRPDMAVLPSQGPRLPLVWDGTPGGEIRISEPATGRIRHFAPLPLNETAGPISLPLCAISDRNGHRITIERTDDGTPTSVRHNAGYHLAVDTADGRVAALRLLGTEDGPDGTLMRSYDYDRGNLSGIVNSSGRTYRLDYDDHHRITQWTDRSDSWYRFTYDEHDRCIQGAGADNFLSCSISYDAETRATAYTDSLGHTTTYQHNELLQLIAQSDPRGNTTSTEWDPYNRLLSRTDPLGNTTRHSYDEDGNLATVVHPDGATSVTTYNEFQLPLAVTEADGTRWEHAYDEHGNLVRITDPVGGTTTFAYNELGGLAGVTDPLGGVHRVESDATGLPVAITDPLGGTTRYLRDAFGRTRQIIDALEGVATLAWTTEGLPRRRTLPDGTTERWLHDPDGRLVEYNDGAGGVTRFEVTHFDLMAAKTGPDGVRLQFMYDTELRLTSVTNASGLVWNYTHDPAGRLVGERDFNGRELSYGYDAAGRLVERTNGAAQSVVYERDVAGRIISRRSGEAVTAVEYDSLGRVLRAVGPEVELRIERDPLGRVLAETTNGLTLSSTYDALGRRTSRRTPAGTTSSWSWDSAGHIDTLDIDGRTLSFAHDALGHEVERALGAGATLAQRWDSAHRLVSQSIGGLRTGHTTAAAERRRDFTYRADGYLLTTAGPGVEHQQFELDPAGRVLSANGTNGAERYGYDNTGNLTHAELPGISGTAETDRSFSGTLVQRAGRTTYLHDGQGRVIRRARKLLSGGSRIWQYTWDAEDRLTDVVTPDGAHWHYIYDPLGRRTAKQWISDAGDVLEQTDFTWDGACLAEQSRTAKTSGLYRGQSVTWEWEPGTFRPVAQLDQDEIDSRFYAMVTDVVGTPTELIDEQGVIAWRARSTLWGLPLDGPDGPDGRGGVDCPLRFPGQYADAETGLHYNHYRYYDPETARYTSPDPIGLAPAPNHHAYVLNPLAWLDPLGLSCSSNAKILGDNMVAAGTHRPPDTAAHHIAASTSKKAASARQQLANFGIDINDASNGIFLPKNLGSANPLATAVHSTVHTNSYYDTVNYLMAGARTADEARDVLSFVRTQLQAGPWPP